MERLLAASKQDRIAALQAKRRRISGHVGPGFIDDPDQPQGRAHLSDTKPVVQHALLDDGAYRVRERSDLIETVGDTVETLAIELEAIEHRLGEPHVPCGRHVVHVGFEHAIAGLSAQGFSRPA